MHAFRPVKITPIGQLAALGTGDAGPVPLGRLPPAKPHRAPAPLRRPAALDAVGDGGSSTYGLAYAIAFQAQVERFEAVHGKLDGADRPAPARPPLPAKRSRFAHWITAGQARVAPSVEITMDVHDGRQSHDAGHVLGWDQHHVLCGVQKAGGDIELRMLPAAQIPRVTSEALQAVQATNARRAGYASRVCSATDFVPAVFKREGKRPREEKVLHIVNGALNGCSVNEPMQRLLDSAVTWRHSCNGGNKKVHLFALHAPDMKTLPQVSCDLDDNVQALEYDARGQPKAITHAHVAAFLRSASTTLVHIEHPQKYTGAKELLVAVQEWCGARGDVVTPAARPAEVVVLPQDPKRVLTLRAMQAPTGGGRRSSRSQGVGARFVWCNDQVTCEGRQHKPWAECRRCRCGMILDRKLLPAAHQFPDRVRKSCGVGGRTAAKQSERRAGGNGPE